MNIIEINEKLEKLNIELINEFDKPKYPVIFIAALPRSGTTLLHQLIISNFSIGYVNNFLAKFWQAPYVGSIIEDEIIDKNYISSYCSNLGNTDGINEPHEWGWFWQKYLNIEKGKFLCQNPKEQDYSILLKNLSAIESTKKYSLIFKNFYTCFNLELIKKILPNSKIIYLEREISDIKKSFIKARKIQNRNDTFLNLFYENNNCENTDTDDQLEKQKDLLMKGMSFYKNSEIITINYNDLINNPKKNMEKIYQFFKLNNCQIKFKTKEGKNEL